MTEDEEFEFYQNDLTEDFKLDRSKVIRKKVDLSKASVQISLKLEYDILDKLKEESEKEGIGYQTHLKNILKSHFVEKELKSEILDLKHRMDALESNLKKQKKRA
jgi:predicted DNA binding CopG/RHH family protein